MSDFSLLNFFTTAFGRYKLFVLPYISAALYNNPRSFAEVLVDDTGFLRNKHINFLNKHFEGRWKIRNFPNKFSKWKNDKFKKSIRWLAHPSVKTDYVYTGDIDIVILRKNIHEGHLKHIEKINKPYSNAVRPNGINMTGLHFIVSNPYYEKLDVTYMNSIIDKISSGKLRPKSLDERLLCRMMKENFGLPNPAFPYRPGHGVHLSLRRTVIKWGGGKNLETLNKMSEEAFWKAGLKVFDPRFLKILKMYKKSEKWRKYDKELGNRIQTGIRSGEMSEEKVEKLRSYRRKLRQVKIRLK